MQCESCTGCCHSCGGDCCPSQVPLTSTEISILLEFAVTPFLPVASKFDLKTPVFLEDSKYTPEVYSHALLALKQRGLIRIDYDLPLTNFNYAVYKNYPMHGSMALTGAGQDVIEQLEYEKN